MIMSRQLGIRFIFLVSTDEYITKKQLAAIRFHRNHRLMLEIFSDTKIPDTRYVVTNSRLVVLRKQVNSLLLHQVSELCLGNCV